MFLWIVFTQPYLVALLTLNLKLLKKRKRLSNTWTVDKLTARRLLLRRFTFQEEDLLTILHDLEEEEAVVGGEGDHLPDVEVAGGVPLQGMEEEVLQGEVDLGLEHHRDGGEDPALVLLGRVENTWSNSDVVVGNKYNLSVSLIPLITVDQ